MDPATAGGHYELAVINPSTLAVSWVTNAIIPTNQITVHVGAIDFTKAPIPMMNGSTGDGATQLLSIRNVSGAMTPLLANPEVNRFFTSRIPLGRWGKPEDIAGGCVFLAAADSDYLNGAVLNIDGGWLGR